MTSRMLLGLAGSLVFGHVYPQGDCTSGPFPAIHLEGMGPGGYGSINYERIVARIEGVHVRARAGLGFERLKDYTRKFDPDLVFPLGVLFTKGAVWQLEVGGGAAITSFVYPGEQDFRPAREQRVHGWLDMGVRWAPRLRGWVIRAGYTPLLEFGGWRHWAGLSVGRIIRG